MTDRGRQLMLAPVAACCDRHEKGVEMAEDLGLQHHFWEPNIELIEKETNILSMGEYSQKTSLWVLRIGWWDRAIQPSELFRRCFQYEDGRRYLLGGIVVPPERVEGGRLPMEMSVQIAQIIDPTSDWQQGGAQEDRLWEFLEHLRTLKMLDGMAEDTPTASPEGAEIRRRVAITREELAELGLAEYQIDLAIRLRDTQTMAAERLWDAVTSVA